MYIYIQIYQIYHIPCSSQTRPESENSKAKADTIAAVREFPYPN